MPQTARPRASRRVAVLAVLPFALGVAFLLLAVAQHRRAHPSGGGHATGSDAWVFDLVGAWVLIVLAIAMAVAILRPWQRSHDS
jgi:hypothetical protein